MRFFRTFFVFDFFPYCNLFWQTLVWRTVVDSVSGPSQFLFGPGQVISWLVSAFYALVLPSYYSPFSNTLIWSGFCFEFLWPSPRLSSLNLAKSWVSVGS